MSATSFDPNAAATADSGVFGLPAEGPFLRESAALVFLPVPWEATTSYGGGTSNGPKAILEASRQVDLFDFDVERPYEAGFFMMPESAEVRLWNQEAKACAREIEGHEDPARNAKVAKVNELGSKLNQSVLGETRKLLKDRKLVGLIGGDHSTPFGAIQAVAEKEASFGILHLDAHSDTRRAYEGFEWSHASIMYNVLEQIPQVRKLTQVGIRDFCEEEWEYCRSQKDRVSVFFDGDLTRAKFEGKPFATQAEQIVATLPERVWISFDIDGLDPRFCPHTGTPVPGGLEFQEANYLFRTLVKSGRKIIGFDLNEVSPDPTGQSEWDANVGARMLYKLAAWTLASQGLAKIRS